MSEASKSLNELHSIANSMKVLLKIQCLDSNSILTNYLHVTGGVKVLTFGGLKVPTY